MKPLKLSKTSLEPEKYLYISDFIKNALEEIQNHNPLFSLRSLALKLGYKNPSFLSDIINKKRKPTHDLVQKINSTFLLSKPNKDYLTLICDLERTKYHFEKEQILAKIRVLLANRKWNYIDLNYLDLLTKWDAILIYNMMGLKDFEMNERYINSKSNKYISKKSISESVKTLTQLNYIKKNKNGTYEISHPNSILTAGDSGIKTQAMTTYHLETLKFITKTYPNLNYDEKDVRTTGMAIKQEDWPQMLEIIKECHNKLMALGQDKDADEVVFFSSQLIPATKKV